ncbi:MAG: M3 family oligoendopeptidase [Bacteroidota bacterium]
MQQFLQVQDARAKRTYIPATFEIEDWESLEVFYAHLLKKQPKDQAELIQFLLERNEVEAMVAEEQAWRFIRMSCDTQDEQKREAYQFFLKEIAPQVSRYDHKLNQQVASHPDFEQLPATPYLTLVRQIKREIDLFREENVDLRSKAQTVAQQHGATNGAMTIEHEGETLTLQQAGKLMESRDRKLREEVWHKMSKRRTEDREKLQGVFDELLALRHQMAQNAGYDSYTRYKFDALGRFDYQPEDVQAFHDSVAEVVAPIYQQMARQRKAALGLDVLRPWDMSVDIFGESPLRPFEAADQLLTASIDCLSRLRPELGQMLQIMDERGFLDLDSRIGKMPGGYNYPLMESGIPFIFMNAAGTQTDVNTMLHESGHAIHSFLTGEIPLTALKHTPHEVSELASMAMELMALDHYDAFYPDPEECVRAKKEQISRCLMILPWIATVDAFQAWLYDHPTHTAAERNAQWKHLYHRFHGTEVSWDGYEDVLENLWLKQGHIFDVPFYYIEYAIAQLGSIAVWRNYKADPQQGLDQYLAALQLGYTQPIPELYATAGIRFDFSKAYIQECMDFCFAEYQKL